MAATLYRAVAADHKKFVDELREQHTLRGKPVTHWSESVTDDGAEIRLRVTLAPPGSTAAPLFGGTVDWPASPAPEQTQVWAFSAANVRALEGDK